ncbi:MAG: hypothetical protein ACRDQT_09230 [Gaiellaceae bacterium]
MIGPAPVQRARNARQVRLYEATYRNFDLDARRRVRLETYGRCDDTTPGVVEVARRWRAARARHRAQLIDDEGEETFARLQRFLSMVHRLAMERRLSRYTLLARRSA